MPRTSAAVYRRRRLVVLLGLILVLAALGFGAWLLIAQPWAHAAPAGTSKQETPAPGTSSPDPTTEATDAADSPSPDPDTTPGIVACDAADIEVTAVTDADTYPEGVLPKLSISLTNTGKTDCTLDVGSSTQRLTVSSGTDEWWRSTDCQQNPSSMIATLAAGATVTSKEPVVWDRTRSSTTTCDQENRPRAPGGGASYHVSVSIGGFTSAETKQIILQ